MHQNLDNTKQDIDKKYTSNVDSIYNHYENKIGEVKSQLFSFKNSVSWKGKINIYDKTINQAIERFNNEIIALQNEKTSVVNTIQVNYSTAKGEAEKKYEFNSLL
ncbi:MAG: hypothetical protein AAGI07_06990 [Bacteroidota bacterium]